MSVQPGQEESVLNEGNRAIKRRDDRVPVAEEHGQGRPCLGDVDDGNVEEFLQTFAAVFAVACLNDGIEVPGYFITASMTPSAAR